MFESIKDDFTHVWTKPNNAVAQIILINAIVFVITALITFITEFSVRSWLGLPSNLTILPGKIWTIFTYMFVHDGLGHIFWNMLAFYWFGKIIQEFLGSNKVISLFVIGGLFGALFYLLAYNMFPAFSEAAQIGNLVGASAGVFAVVVGSAVFMPNYTLYLLLVGPVKIKYIALVYVFLFIIGTRGMNAGGEFAHLGGAAAGWLYISQIKRGSDIGAWVISVLDFFKALFSPQPKIKVTHRSKSRKKEKVKVSGSIRSDGTSQDEIDAILDKISHSGYESLSKDEKQKLFNASGGQK
ncbi:MAG: rhomboid family intramembrane serine protease [Cytophagales bacterium]|nr:rhomboid family intramembrane serine protease [Cytophagales bacterium]